MPVGGGPAVRVTDDAAIDATPVWSADGSHLFFSSSRGGTTNLWRVPIDERTGERLGAPEPVIVPAQNAVHPALSRDGRRLVYMASSLSSDVYAMPFDIERGRHRAACRAGSSADRITGATCGRPPTAGGWPASASATGVI